MKLSKLKSITVNSVPENLINSIKRAIGKDVNIMSISPVNLESNLKNFGSYCISGDMSVRKYLVIYEEDDEAED